jgi:uncharacterized OsmC-like protein
MNIYTTSEHNMSGFTFQMIMRCHYSGDKNKVESLHVEHLVDDEWQELILDTYSPGFDVFIYSILSCQHMFFRNNATEYGLSMTSAEALITIVTDEHRSIESLHSEFTGKLIKGTADIEKVKSITARVGLCPATINLKEIADKKITVNFETA